VTSPQLLGRLGLGGKELQQLLLTLAQGMPTQGPPTAGDVAVEERPPVPEVERQAEEPPIEESKPIFRRKINVIGLSPSEEAWRLAETPTVTSSDAPPESPTENSPPSGQLNLTEWAPFLDGDPGDFVQALVERVQFGEPEATLAAQLILSFSDAQALLAALAPHKAGAPP